MFSLLVLCLHSYVIYPIVLVVGTALAGLPHIRKCSEKDDIHQGQGKVREFYFKL